MTRWACCLALLLSAAPDAAQPPDKPIRLTLRPAPAPAPALKYRLLPELSEMKPGNAALLYQRAHSFEWWTNVRRLPYYHDIHDWLDWPPEKFPRDKVDFVRRFGALLEVDRAARRYHCDWEMTQRIPEEGIGMLLPDVQGFREYAMLLAVRCRLEIADGQYDKAIYTLQTGIALGRHVNEAPITINALVGNAIITVMLHEAERLLQAPDAPNLYWALTTLPRPLIDLRRALEGEKMMLEAEFPVLKTIETQPLSPHDQQQTLKKLNDPLYMGLLRGEGSFTSQPQSSPAFRAVFWYSSS